MEIIGSAPTVKFNNAIYVDFVKTLYCSKKEKTEQLSFEEVQKITMKYPSSKKEGKLKNQQLWMPPASALLKLATNVQCLIDYYLTAGYHNKDLPDFISRGCLKKAQAGEIEFDLGEESKILNIETIWKTSENTFTVPTDPIALGKRKSTETPQKGRRRKQKPVASTLKKNDIP
ncbi:unnamed protein product [Mytilus coruscus]|uniref:Uncharacterized protein n=1 Tax=Mytilus coruscus TaxID=42192 RepID=A0A6J8BWX6_MYTCO|nr:unnamed protein product [Mytilus coruscus]